MYDINSTSNYSASVLIEGALDAQCSKIHSSSERRPINVEGKYYKSKKIQKL